MGQHTSVLLAEALDLLAVRAGGSYADGTLGLGGHAEAILARSAPGGRLLGVDTDSEALELARARLQPFGARAHLLHADFRRLPELLGDERPAGILLDLGVSSLQLDTPERGFSFRHDGPLDMRMDRSSAHGAAELVNRASEPALAQLLHEYGEEPRARSVARAIVEARRRGAITTTKQLATVVRRAAYRPRFGLDPATRSFQAIRIAVNRELADLGTALQRLARCLAPAGRLVVIAFHSLEDREVKLSFRSLQAEGFEILTKKPLRAGAQELRENARARSAKLRALRRSAPRAA